MGLDRREFIATVAAMAAMAAGGRTADVISFPGEEPIVLHWEEHKLLLRGPCAVFFGQPTARDMKGRYFPRSGTTGRIRCNSLIGPVAAFETLGDSTLERPEAVLVLGERRYTISDLVLCWDGFITIAKDMAIASGPEFVFTEIALGDELLANV